MTVQEFIRSYFSLGADIRTLEISAKGIGCKLYSGDIDSETYIIPQVREMPISSWTINGKKIRVFVPCDKTVAELINELRTGGKLK